MARPPSQFLDGAVCVLRTRRVILRNRVCCQHCGNFLPTFSHVFSRTRSATAGRFFVRFWQISRSPNCLQFPTNSPPIPPRFPRNFLTESPPLRRQFGYRDSPPICFRYFRYRHYRPLFRRFTANFPPLFEILPATLAPDLFFYTRTYDRTGQKFSGRVAAKHTAGISSYQRGGAIGSYSRENRYLLTPHRWRRP